MSGANAFSETQESLLLAIWKLKGVGSNRVNEIRIKEELTNAMSEEDLKSAFRTLQAGGFLDTKTEGDQLAFSLTPLGVAILRKTEEDRLQELK